MNVFADNKLSRASEVGSLTNPPWARSDKTLGQGSFYMLNTKPDFFSHDYL